MNKEDIHEALHILEKIDESLEYANCSNFEKVLLSHLKLLTKSHSWIENQTSLANALKRQELKLKERELDLMKEQNDALVRISEELKASRKGWVL